MTDEMTSKRLLRQQTRSLLLSAMITNETCHQAGWAIRSKIGRLLVPPIKSISIFISRPPEVDTRPLIEYLFKLRKQVYLPSWDQEEMRMVLISGGVEEYKQILADQGETRMRIPMPPYPINKEIPPQLDLIILPSLLFDRHGNRLGHGYGFYDRFLLQYNRHYGCDPLKIGISHDLQIHPDILPVQPHDCTVDLIVTPTQIIGKCLSND